MVFPWSLYSIWSTDMKRNLESIQEFYYLGYSSQLDYQRAQNSMHFKGGKCIS